MNLYEITKGEAFYVFKSGGPVYGSSVGKPEAKLAFAKADGYSPAVNWVTEHTRLQALGLTQPVQYWTE